MTRKQIRANKRLRKAADRRMRDTAFDPITGKPITGPLLGRIRTSRVIQTSLIDKKKQQRRAFAKKSPWQRQVASEAGRLHQSKDSLVGQGI